MVVAWILFANSPLDILVLVLWGEEKKRFFFLHAFLLFAQNLKF